MDGKILSLHLHLVIMQMLSLRHCLNKYKLAREREKDKDEDFENVKEGFFYFIFIK